MWNTKKNKYTASIKKLPVLFPAFLILAACTMPQQTASPKSDDPQTVIVDELPPADSTADAAAAGTGAAIVERLLPTGILEIGDREARVSLLLFTNHSCPYCRRFQLELMPNVLRTYVATGKLRVGIVPIPLEKYPLSERQALSLLCAASQGKGWSAHETLFDGTIPSNDASCPENDVSRQRDLQRSLIRSLGIRLIPAYVIDGKIFTGLPEWTDLRGQIDEALRESTR